MGKINRRLWLLAIYGAVIGFVSRRRGPVLNYREMGALEHRFIGGKCLVDGVEIESCWYVDKAAGIVRTYDLHGDGKSHKYQIDETGHDAKWREIRGAVRLFLPDGTEC